jgi:uncharacterized protein YndB with AHSA1/START domain
MTKTKPRTEKAKVSKGRELVITRMIDAPRDRVWKAWADPERVRQWWGPKHFTSPVAKSEFRVGGTYLYCMRSPEGKDYWSTGVFREIVRHERIVYTDSFADEKGRVVPGTYYGMGEDFPLEMVVTVTFEERDGKTKLTLTHAGMPGGPHDENAKQGWNETLDKLTEFVGDRRSRPKGRMTFVTPSDREIIMERVFDAPRERVFKAYTDPKAIPLWWGPRRYTTIVEKMDVRPGGTWRYISRGSDGAEFAFHGVYREIVRPKRIVTTFEFEGTPGHVVVDTATFEEHDGKTKVTVTSRFETVEDRDEMVKTGMEEGARESWDRLAEYLAEED